MGFQHHTISMRHWGRAPGKVAIMTIVDNGNDNYYGYDSGNDTGHDNGNDDGNNIYLG